MFAKKPLPEQPLLAVRELVGRQEEHLFLSELTGRSVSPLRAGRISNMRDFSVTLSAMGPAWTLR